MRNGLLGGQALIPPRRGSRQSGRAKQLLYISYDGVLEPLGESQIVQYLVNLSPQYGQVLLTFEKPHDLAQSEKVDRMDRILSGAGIEWIALRYHKYPLVLSTLWDVIVASAVAMRVYCVNGVRFVHARGYVSALIAVIIKMVCGTKFLFDMRGFWADEKLETWRLRKEANRDQQENSLKILFATEGFRPDEKVAEGHWREQSVVYKITKRCEKLFFESADAIVSLTVAGVNEFPRLGYQVPEHIPIEVIPTCTDLARFRPAPKDVALEEKFGLSGCFVIGCVGTMSSWYLRRPMLDYLAYLSDRLDSMKILIVTRENHIALLDEAVAVGIPAERLILTRAEFYEMPAYIRLMDVGLFFIRACFGKKGSTATKLGEFLASGIPVIINDGVGDSGAIVRDNRVGVVLPDVSPIDFARSIPEVLLLRKDPDLPRRCRDAAERIFDLKQGVRRYAKLYKGLL